MRAIVRQGINSSDSKSRRRSHRIAQPALIVTPVYPPISRCSPPPPSALRNSSPSTQTGSKNDPHYRSSLIARRNRETRRKAQANLTFCPPSSGKLREIHIDRETTPSRVSKTAISARPTETKRDAREFIAMCSVTYLSFSLSNRSFRTIHLFPVIFLGDPSTVTCALERRMCPPPYPPSPLPSIFSHASRRRVK